MIRDCFKAILKQQSKRPNPKAANILVSMQLRYGVDCVVVNSEQNPYIKRIKSQIKNKRISAGILQAKILCDDSVISPSGKFFMINSVTQYKLQFIKSRIVIQKCSFESQLQKSYQNLSQMESNIQVDLMLNSYQKIIKLMGSLFKGADLHQADQAIDNTQIIAINRQNRPIQFLKDNQLADEMMETGQMENKCEMCKKQSQIYEKLVRKKKMLEIQTYASDLTIQFLKLKNDQLNRKVQELQQVILNQQEHSASNDFVNTYQEIPSLTEQKLSIEGGWKRDESSLSMNLANILKNQEVYEQMIETFNPEQLKKIIRNRYLQNSNRFSEEDLVNCQQNKEKLIQTKKKNFSLKQFRQRTNFNMIQTHCRPILSQKSVGQLTPLNKQSECFKIYSD